MTLVSKEESGIKVKGENRVKKIISARVLGGMAAMLLVVASIIGLNQQTDTAQAATTGSINLVNNWSKLSTATSPSKLDSTYGGTTPSYVGSGKTLYATYTSTGRHIMSGSNQLVIEVVDADLNSAVVKSTIVILKGNHSASSTLITNYVDEIGDTGKKEYAIPIIDNNSDGVVNGQDLTFACRWIGSGYTDPVGEITTSNGDTLLDGTVIKAFATGSSAANKRTDAAAATSTLGRVKLQSDGMAYARSGTEAALMGAFNDSPKCSTATSSLVSVALLGSAGDPVSGVSAQIQISTPSSIADTLKWEAGGTRDADIAATVGTTNVIAGLIQWKTSRINTTTAKVWSGVVSKSNAVDILLTETGRNTGVFNGIVNLFDNENTNMPFGMQQSVAAGTGIVLTATGDQTAYPTGSFGNSHTESPCKSDCASGSGRATSSQTSTLAVKDGGTVYAEYTDANDADSNTNQNRQVTAKVDATVPTVEINSPAHSSENQTRTPTFSLTATEAASGLDVSGSLLILQEGSEANTNSGEDGAVGGNGVDVMTTSGIHAGNACTARGSGVDCAGGDWLVSSLFTLTGGDITLGSSTDESNVARTAASVTVNRGTSADGVSSLTYTYTPSSALPLGADTPVDHWIDFQGVATDLAGNVGYTDSSSTVDAGVLNKYGAHHVKIDQKLPSISAAYTGWWWDTSIDSKNKTHKHTSTKANAMVVEFDGNITDIDATDFQITFDDGTTHTPTTAEIHSALPKQVFLTLGASMSADNTPKVALVGSVSDIAGNSTSTGSLANATDKIHPSVTATLSGGTGTGSAALEGASDLTKSSITLTVTTDEELVSNPKVDVYDLGMSKSSKISSPWLGACGVASTCGNSGAKAVDDYNIRTLDVSEDPPVTTFTKDRNGTATSWSSATVDGTSAAVILDASMTAQGTKTFKYTINAASGNPGDDGEKTVVVTATDKATQGNITIHGSISSTSSYMRFMLDDTAPQLTITPTAGSTTTQTKPYIVLDYSGQEASKVTLNTATLDGVDISGDLSTTDNKKFYYVPSSDLAAGEHTIVSKATDYAGNVSSILTRKFSVAARKDFKLSLLAGWNAKSVPSDPVNPAIDSVFSNPGVDMVLSYSDHTWSSATKDSGSGKFVGSLKEIHSGHGYWVHNNNFESQAVALTGPVAPSAGSPPAVVTIPTVAGWNFVGVSDVTRANTEGADGTTIKTQDLYFGDLTDSSAGGHDIVYKYDTTNLKFVEVAASDNVATGEGLWIYIVPAADGSILPIVPPAP